MRDTGLFAGWVAGDEGGSWGRALLQPASEKDIRIAAGIGHFLQNETADVESVYHLPECVEGNRTTMRSQLGRGCQRRIPPQRHVIPEPVHLGFGATALHLGDSYRPRQPSSEFREPPWSDTQFVLGLNQLGYFAGDLGLVVAIAGASPHYRKMKRFQGGQVTDITEEDPAP